MKKLFLTMLSLVCLLAASAETLTVCEGDGQTTNDYIPIYGWYIDVPSTKSQVLYPASELTAMAGKQITEMTFYANADIAFSGGTQKVSLGEVEIEAMTGLVTEGLTQVFEGEVTRSGSQMTITFKNAYQYAGGNLLLSIDITGSGTAKDAKFYGTATDYNSSYYKTNYSDPTAQQFLPKTTFTYEGELAEYDARINKEAIDFGTSKLSELPKTETVTLRNMGANPFTPQVTFSNEAFSTTYVAAELASAGSVEIPVVFNPNAIGEYEGTMTITAFEGEGGTFTVALSGNAYGGAVAPEAIDFGSTPLNKVADIAAQTVTWTNYSGQDITPTVTVAAPFGTTYEAAAVASGESVQIPVTFAPDAKGNFEGTLTINAGAAGTYTVALTGAVGEVTYDITVCDGTATNTYIPINGDYYNVVGTISQVVYPSSEIASMAGMKISGITFYAQNAIGFSDGEQKVSLAEVGSKEMTGKVDTGLTQVFQGVSTINGSQVTINFDTPYQYNGGNLLISFEITTKGKYAYTYFLGIPTDYTSGWCNKLSYSPGQKFLPKATFAYQGERAEYKALVNKEAIDFGTSKLSELPKTETVTLRNLGANPFTPQVTFSNDAFTTTYVAAELASAGSVDIPVAFQGANGQHEGTMTIDAGAAGTFTVALTGKVYGGAVAPETIDFGSTPLNKVADIAAQTVTWTNYSGEDITPTVTATENFGTTYEAAAVADGESVQIPVTFAPNAKGEFTGTLTINAGVAGTYTVALTGAVVDEVYDITVCNGEHTNSLVPINGLDYDYTTNISQMIYPAEMLTKLKGHKITSLTFYPTNVINITGATAAVSLMETEQTKFESAALATGEFTPVATWKLSGEDATPSLIFDTPFLYRGGNLMVQVAKSSETTTNKSATFYGANQTENAAYHQNSGTYNNSKLVKFLPKATFGYDPEQVVVYEIEMNPAGGEYEGLQNVKATVTPELPEGASIKYIFAEEGVAETPAEKAYPTNGVDVIRTGKLTFILRDANNEELARTSNNFTINPLFGDLNGDGRADVTDVNVLVNIILGKKNPTDTNNE